MADLPYVAGVSTGDIQVEFPVEEDPWSLDNEEESLRFWTQPSSSSENHTISSAAEDECKQSMPTDEATAPQLLINRFLKDVSNNSSQADDDQQCMQQCNTSLDEATDTRSDMGSLADDVEKLLLSDEENQEKEDESGSDNATSEKSLTFSESDAESSATLTEQNITCGELQQYDDYVVNYLKLRDEQYKVSKSEPENQVIAEGAQRIIVDLFRNLEPRFRANILPSGSYFEDLKVGKPDEFDFMAEIISLSKKGVIDAVPSDRPGFLHVTIVDKSTLKEWRDCVAFICQHRVRADSCKEKECENVSVADIGGTLILAPEKVQETLRLKLDEAMKKVALPENWQHGGYEKPKYSGYRRHGPATLFQFQYHRSSGKKPLNVTLDVTLSIRMNCPINPRDVNFRPLSDEGPNCLEQNHPMRKWLQDSLQQGPGLHLIPLYSKLHVKTGYYGHKNCWRLSCSMIERNILEKFHPACPDSIPKRIIRLLKWVRDRYLTDSGKNRKRKKFKKTKEKLHQNATQSQVKWRQGPKYKVGEREENSSEKKKGLTVRQDSEGERSKNSAQCVKENICDLHHADGKSNMKSEPLNTIENKRVFIQRDLPGGKELKHLKSAPEKPQKSVAKQEVDKRHRNETLVDQSGFLVEEDIPLLIKNFRSVFDQRDIATFSNKSPVPNVEDIFPAPSDEGSEATITSTYATLVSAGEQPQEPGVFLDSSRVPRVKLHKRVIQTDVQSKEVEELKQQRPRGEHYGPITYVTSIELKMLVLYLIEQNPCREDWNEAQMADMVYSLCKAIFDFYIEGEMIVNYFFDIPICSPFSENKWFTAVAKLTKLVEFLHGEWTNFSPKFPTRANRA